MPDANVRGGVTRCDSGGGLWGDLGLSDGAELGEMVRSVVKIEESIRDQQL